MQIVFCCSKQQHKNIMFLYITFMLTLIDHPVHPNPFPDQMLHRWDMTLLTSHDSNRKADKLQYTY